MMKGNLSCAHPTGFTLGLTLGIVYVVCVLLSVLWPESLLWLVSHWIHTVDFSKITVPYEFNFGGFLAGLIVTVLSGYVVGVLFGWIYNRCVHHCTNWGWIKNP